MTHAQDYKDVASYLAKGMREGTFTLRHAAGLSDDEIDAVVAAAKRCEDEGDCQAAVHIYGLLIGFDPRNPKLWRGIAALLQRMKQYAAAVACHEALALLDHRTESDIEREATCLRAMGQTRLADELPDAVRILVNHAPSNR